MLWSKKKASVVDRRIKELGKEMAQVRRELATLARPSSAKPAFPPGRSAESPFGASKADDDLFAHAARQAQGSVRQSPDVGQGALPARNATHSVAGGRPGEESGSPGTAERGYPTLFDQSDTNPLSVRKRFANYFMAGHFQNLRPLRQENRIIRNKAIVMLILVLVLVFWLVYYFQRH